MNTITTTRGDMDPSLLHKQEGQLDSPTETINWVEYRMPGEDEIIHRSVHLTLKETVSSVPVTPAFT